MRVTAAVLYDTKKPVWVLDLASELVFVGDEGTTEARGASHREGVRVRTAGEASGLAHVLGGCDDQPGHIRHRRGRPVGASRDRARGPDRPPAVGVRGQPRDALSRRPLRGRGAPADRSGYTLFDFTARYRYKWLEAFVSIENLTNVDWREAQFYFTSRLTGEPAGGVPDIHYAAGTPRSVLGGLALRFYPPHVSGVRYNLPSTRLCLADRTLARRSPGGRGAVPSAARVVRIVPTTPSAE